jgi:acetolactate synthase small subunit
VKAKDRHAKEVNRMVATKHLRIVDIDVESLAQVLTRQTMRWSPPKS